VPLPRPLIRSKEPHFSFAGLKSAVVRAHQSGEHRPEDLAASFQQAVVDCLKDRLEKAISDHDPVEHLVVAGGVAANTPIRMMLKKLADEHDMDFTAPPLWLCTDNAAMIAWAGVERLQAGLTDPLDVAARPRWPLDPHAEKARGAGVKA
jgi:N6-L-threonylcarbamoyladenine synthase